jgi:uncharacterized RmlC-like cupin family protein
MFAEDERHIPFHVRRVFAIYQVPAGQTRGAHAHRTSHQFIVMLAGGSRISIDEGAETWEERLDRPTQGLYVPPFVWIELRDFTPDAVCLVLASEHFDDADYIRDRVEFHRLAATGKEHPGIVREERGNQSS